MERDDWRTLRLDRLTPKPPWGPRFAVRAVPDEQVRDFTAQSVTTAPYRYRCRVLLHASADEARGRFGPAAVQIEARGADRCLLTAGSNSLVEFAGYLAVSGLELTVLDDGDGPALRAALVEVAERLLRAGRP